MLRAPALAFGSPLHFFMLRFINKILFVNRMNLSRSEIASCYFGRTLGRAMRVRFTTIESVPSRSQIKKGLPTAVPFLWWRRRESNPRPQAIRIKAGYMLSRCFKDDSGTSIDKIP